MRSFVAVILSVAVPSVSEAQAPLTPGYKENDFLRVFFLEYRVAGPGVVTPGETGLLLCTYSTRPVVMIYTRALTPEVVRLIKTVDKATADHQKERLGSYVVLLCDGRERAKDLESLAKKEKIDNALLSLVVLKERRPWEEANRMVAQFEERFGTEMETTVILATGARRVKGCYAFRKGELTDKSIVEILRDLPRIMPRKDDELSRR